MPRWHTASAALAYQRPRSLFCVTAWSGCGCVWMALEDNEGSMSVAMWRTAGTKSTSTGSSARHGCGLQLEALRPIIISTTCAVLSKRNVHGNFRLAVASPRILGEMNVEL